MKILQLTAHFKPNIGGVETHLSDLCKAAVKRGFTVLVLTYRPLQTRVSWQIYERGKGIEIIRIPWIPNLFYKLINNPILEFIYLLPGLFFVTPYLLFSKSVDVIHAHGLVAGFVGIFWGKAFGKKVIISTHSIYNFPKNGLYRNFVGFILKSADYCLGLSKQAVREIESLAVAKDKVKNFTYWIDLNKFKVQSSKLKVKKKLGWNNEFVVLFVGRLVIEKGIIELLESVKNWDKKISLKIIGSGPLESEVKEAALKFKNVDFIGGVDSDNLPLYYSGSDILIMPSTSEEGFGRVIMESLACGTPVIGSRRGAIPEAMDETVGKFIDVSPTNIKDAVEYFLTHPDELGNLARNSRKFAERRYSEKNAEAIVRLYQG